MRLQDVRLKSLGTGLLGAGLLGLLLGTSGMAKAQDARDEAKPPQQEEPKQDEAKPPKQEEPKDAKPAREGTKPEDAKPAKNDKQDVKPNDVKPNDVKPNNEKPNNEMKPEQGQERPQGNNGGNRAAGGPAQRGQRIPDDKFRANFGRQHRFRVQTTVVEGQSRFQYGGYWFALVDPWPVGWAYTDDCYIDFIDGEYVLIDLLHPGVQIAVFVVM
jgi:hypothetical protein